MKKGLIAAAIGGTLGFLYYYFVGCTSGSCAITSNPYTSILWGSLFGFFITSSPCCAGRSCEVTNQVNDEQNNNSTPTPTQPN